MLRITTESRRGKLFLTVEGSLSGPRVATLEGCWRELTATTPRPKFCVNLCGVSFIDNAGKVLLKEMHRQGAELLAEGCLNQAIVTEIVESKEFKEKSASRDSKDDDTKGTPFIFYGILLGLLLLPAFASAQTKTLLFHQMRQTESSEGKNITRRFNRARADFARAIGQMEKTYSK